MIVDVMLAYLVVAVVCVSMVAASGPCAPKEDLLQMLNMIHKAPSYSHLSSESKTLLSEMISAAQSCQLTGYIYSNGLYKVLDLLDSLSPTEAHLLNGYLKGHLEFEQHLASLFPGTTKGPTAHAG